MHAYEGRIEVKRAPDQAFAFLADPGSVGHGMRLALERTPGSIKALCEGADTPPAAKHAPRSADDLPDSRPFGGSATLNPDI